MTELELVPVPTGSKMKVIVFLYIVVVVFYLAYKWAQSNDTRERQAGFLASRMNKLSDDVFNTRLIVENMREEQFARYAEQSRKEPAEVDE